MNQARLNQLPIACLECETLFSLRDIEVRFLFTYVSFCLPFCTFISIILNFPIPVD